MPTLFLYLLKLSISLSFTWLFYRLVLRHLTFYRLNRWYLLGYMLFSFFIPIIDIGPIANDTDQPHQPVYIRFIPVVSNYTPPATHPLQPAPGASPWTLAGLVLLIGIGVLLTRMLLRTWSLTRIKRKARLLSREAGVRIYQVDGPITPFSFGNAIFINASLHTKREWQEIILHEYVHIRQRHTIDILLAEAVAILNWYNPFAWALRHSIRQNLEFIADQQVVENGIDKKEYQYHLLSVMGHPRYRLANNFNFSSLKKRIIMMNKIRSARLNLLRFLFLLPLLAFILLAFRDRFPRSNVRTGPVFVNAAGIAIAYPAKNRLAGVTVRDQRSGLQAITDVNGYYKLGIPVTVDSIRVHLDYSKPGYEPVYNERFWSDIKETSGQIDIAPLTTLAPHTPEFFMVPPGFQKAPADPGYSDAVAELERILTLNSQINHFQSVQAAHPEIGLFYVTEDKQRRLVIHVDGSVERYGYPATPSLAEMDKKYGPLPYYMRTNERPVNTGYLARWAAISAEAEREFHPKSGNPKAIIFPGDSRVIAVDATGKATVYDMDNTVDPKERRGFELLYGNLPNCVPEKGGVPPVPVFRKPAPAVDTTPLTPGTKTSTTTATPATAMAKAGDSTPKSPLPPGYQPVAMLHGNPIYIVDGKRMPDSANVLQHLNPDTIESITVLKTRAATAQYGPDAAARGVLLITLKKPQKQP